MSNNNWKRANENKAEVNLYQQQANKICKTLKQSVNLYKNNKVDQARNLSDNTYWNVYDNILEIKYRPLASPEYIFNVENNFHSLTEMMITPVSSKSITKVNDQSIKLCKEVNKEAAELSKN